MSTTSVATAPHIRIGRGLRGHGPCDQVGKKRRWIFPQQQFSLFVGKESDEMAEGEQKKNNIT